MFWQTFIHLSRWTCPAEILQCYIHLRCRFHLEGRLVLTNQTKSVPKYRGRSDKPTSPCPGELVQLRFSLRSSRIELDAFSICSLLSLASVMIEKKKRKGRRVKKMRRVFHQVALETIPMSHWIQFRKDRFPRQALFSPSFRSASIHLKDSILALIVTIERLDFHYFRSVKNNACHLIYGQLNQGLVKIREVIHQLVAVNR